MFGVPVEKHGVNGDLRQKGKIAELALGYGGSVGALKSMGALEMGLSEEELQPLVTAWRDSNPMITQLKSVSKRELPQKHMALNLLTGVECCLSRSPPAGGLPM